MIEISGGTLTIYASGDGLDSNGTLTISDGYIYVANPPFLESMIELFQNNHHLTIEKVCKCFSKFSNCYICQKIKEGTDFDNVLYFPDQNPDLWYHCVKMEMEHTIYHRFAETDYRLIVVG